MRKFILIISIIIFNSLICLANDTYILIENNVNIGEYCNYKTNILKLKNDFTDIFDSPDFTNKLDVLKKDDDFVVEKSIFILKKYGEIKLKDTKFSQSYNSIKIFDKNNKMISYLDYLLSHNYTEGQSIELHDKLCESIKNKLSKDIKLPLYKYISEGYHNVKVDSYFIEMDQRSFEIISPVEYQWLFKIKSFSGKTGWINAHHTQNQMPQNIIQKKNGNFILYVSNQSIQNKIVDIRVFIDDKLALNKYFDVAGKKMIQHAWYKYYFKLSPGVHNIEAISITGQAKLNSKVIIENDNKYGLLEYWYSTNPGDKSEKIFTFRLQDKKYLFE